MMKIKEIKCSYVYFIVNNDDTFTKFDDKYSSTDFNDILSFAKKNAIRAQIMYSVDFGILLVDDVEYHIRINKNEDVEYSKHRLLWKVIR